MYTVSSLAYYFSNKHNLRENVISIKLYNKKKDNKHVHEQWSWNENYFNANQSNQSEIYKDIVVYVQWLGYYRSLARLHVTGSVTRVVLPHL